MLHVYVIRKVNNSAPLQIRLNYFWFQITIFLPKYLLCILKLIINRVYWKDFFNDNIPGQRNPEI